VGVGEKNCARPSVISSANLFISWMPFLCIYGIQIVGSGVEELVMEIRAFQKSPGKKETRLGLNTKPEQSDTYGYRE
jgi:hypothetical protein